MSEKKSSNQSKKEVKPKKKRELNSLNEVYYANKSQRDE